MYSTKATETLRILEFIKEKTKIDITECNNRQISEGISLSVIPNFSRIGIETYAVQKNTLVILVTGEVQNDEFFPTHLAFVDWTGNSILAEKNNTGIIC